MKQHLKFYNEKITNKLLIKDMFIALLTTALVLTNDLCTFKSNFQFIATILAWWFVFTSAIYTYDEMKIKKWTKITLRNIDEQMQEERKEAKEDER